MEIKVLGPGCMKCKRLEQSVRDAVEELGLDAKITKVEDIMEIMGYGIATTPAVIVDGKVLVKGRSASKEEMKKLLAV